MDFDNTCETIIGFAYKIHNTMGFGYDEAVYENCMMVELRRAGIKATQQRPLKVWYEGEIVGDYRTDVVVEEDLILELKSVTHLVKRHEVQLVNYLTATNKPTGLLLNFGEEGVEVRRKFREHRPRRL